MSGATVRDEDPVTTIISRKVKAGHEAEYERWLAGIAAAASAFPGYLGANVMRPSDKTKPEYVSIFRFDSYASLKRWQESEIHREWQERLPRDVLEGDAQISRMTGLEVWFTAPGAAALAQPSRHKMAIVLIVVVFAMLTTLTPLFAWAFGGLHPKVRLLIVVATQVSLMTYVVMPTVTRLLSRWLYAKSSLNR